MHLGLDDTVSKREVQKINTYREFAEGFAEPSDKVLQFPLSPSMVSDLKAVSMHNTRTENLPNSTSSLPVPSSATPCPDAALKNVIVVDDKSGDEELEEGRQ